MKTPTLPTLSEIERAAEMIEPVIVKTPLVPLHGGSAVRVLLKPEIHQVVSSFKIRGVFHAVACFSETERRRGLSTVSAGNTAQALAWCGRYFGVSARSLMPESAPPSKIEAVRDFGAEPVLVSTEELFRFLREHGWEEEPYAFVHPWTDWGVLTGHASMGLEIVAECPEVETVLIPVGGGGLITGVGWALKQKKPEVRIVAVEPEGCCALSASFAAGRPMSVECATLCDGVAVPYITEEMYPLLRQVVDEVVLVSEDAVRSAIKRLALRDKMVVEGSGALSVAAALAAGQRWPDPLVCLVTGGSLDPMKLLDILADPALS